MVETGRSSAGKRVAVAALVVAVAVAVAGTGAVAAPAAGAAPDPAPVARFDPDDPTFTATPWPSDGLDFANTFPNPGDRRFLDTYVNYADATIGGFSRNGAVYFGLTMPLDPATLPSPAAAMTDPRAAAQLVDLTAGSPEYGRRFPVEFAQRDGDADPYYSGPALVMRPVDGFPLADAHTYCAFLTDDLRGVTGRPLATDQAFPEALSQDPALAPLQTWLKRGSAVPRGDVAVGTCFTTQDATGELRAVETVLAALPTADVYDVEPGATTAGYRQVLARYRSPDFQTGTKPYFSAGGDFEPGPDGRPVVQDEEELRVRIVLPWGDAPADGWPVVLYGHGTGGDWASCLDIADDVTRGGLAMVCTDQPLHGERGVGVDPAFATFNILNPAAGRTNLRQGSVDTSWLGRLIADGRFAAADVALDPGGIVLFGHSQGAVTGAMTLAVAPGIEGGVLSAATGLFGSAGLLRRQDPIDFGGFLSAILGIPPGALDSFHPVSTLFQTVWDATDPINHAPDWADHVFMTAGTADTASLINATNAVAAAGRVPIIQPVAHPSPAHELRGLVPASLPVHANVALPGGEHVTAGLRQVGGGGHFVAFTDKETRSLWRGFLGTFLGTDAPTIAPVGPPPPGGGPPPANDNVASAAAIDALPYSDTQLTGAATTEPGEPQPCAEVGATVWYRLTPEEDAVVSLDTAGSTFDTVLAVYTGDDELIACNDDVGGGLQSHVEFDAAAGTTYLIQAGGFAGDHGMLVVNGDAAAPPPPPPPAPANDLFEDATAIDALPFADAQATDAASSDAGEPQPCAAIGATVWYRFTPKEDIVVDVDTFGSTFDTALAVYTGDALDSLDVVDCNDDAEGLQSRVVFEAVAGTTYYIQAGGFAADHGELLLNVATG